MVGCAISVLTRQEYPIVTCQKLDSSFSSDPDIAAKEKAMNPKLVFL